MTKGITEKEPNPEIVYADIFHHPRHQSDKHPHMSLYDRSAQFAPFAALVGYDDMVSEEARFVDSQSSVEGMALELLNQKLNLISDVIADGTHPKISITYFEPDKKKSGGKYLTITEEIKKVDTVNGKLILMKTAGRAEINVAIDFDKISELHGELVDYLDEQM